MNAKDFFVVDTMESAFEADSLASSIPLIPTIDRMEEISEAFNTITYKKGASLLAMLMAVMGEDNFYKGVKVNNKLSTLKQPPSLWQWTLSINYLRKFAYSNVDTEDLWEELDSVGSRIKGPKGGRLNTKLFADQWARQMGYPLVTVETVNSTTFVIFQERYKQNPKAHELEKYRSPPYKWQWDLPIWYHINNEPVKLKWLTRRSHFLISADTALTPIVLNAGRRCFYRQNYDEDGWRKIIRQLKNNHKVRKRS
ncbi:hypothetical protein COOONC_07981 [Cooperia oncophora]